MPVELGKSKARGTAMLRCAVEGCEARFGPIRTWSAAPELDACEEAEKHGWGYTIGFWAMLCGPQAVCPAHAKRAGGK